MGTWQIKNGVAVAAIPNSCKISAHFLLFKDKIRDPATRFHRLDDPQAAWKVS